MAKLTIGGRIKQLQTESKTGSQIAAILRDEGYTLVEAKNGLFNMGYTLHQCKPRNKQVRLHVSDLPLSPARAIAVLYTAPCKLPSVVWNL
jgi:hypothetical protein